MTAKKRTRKSRKWISRLFFLLLIVAACVLCYFVWDAYFRDKSPKGDDPKQQDSSVETKTDDKKEEDKTEQKDEKEKVPQYDGDDPNTAPGLTGAITYTGVSNGYLRIRVNIDQYLAGGTCKLKLLGSGGASYEETVDIVDSAATATCTPFNVATTKIPSGKVSISILVTSGAKTGTIEGEVNL